MTGALQSPEEALDLLELELQTVMSHHMGAEVRPRSAGQVDSATVNH